MATSFPPGDISLININDDLLRRSLWREFSLAFHLIKQAINPKLPLYDCVIQWKNISKMLSERPRNRKKQIETLYLLNK